MPEITILIDALATRPEILGIVALSSIMGWMVKKKKGHQKASANNTPLFNHAIKAQSWGILGLITILIIRELGKIAILIFR